MNRDSATDTNSGRGRSSPRRSREQQEIHEEPHPEEDMPWFQNMNLPYIKARPGFVQRYVRVRLRNEEDYSNFAREMQLGFVPRRADSVSDVNHVPTISHGQFDGVIGVRDCILMERPVEIDRRHKAAIDARTRAQAQAVMSDLGKEEHKSMPIEVDMRTRVEKGRVRRPPVAADADEGVGELSQD